ncbi:MAG: helix-turn-helix domain-containing protein [Clostridiales bacterium]|nr:helix-turn-helix domain-containing protein [Clostridiales bacterium]
MQTAIENKSFPAFYSVEDIRRILGIGRNSAYKLVGETDFPSIYVGNRVVIPADLFQAWVSRQATQRKEGGINVKHP